MIAFFSIFVISPLLAKETRHFKIYYPEKSASGSVPAMPKGDILVAEDDTVLCQLYQRKFSLEGYKIRTAADGEETIKLLTEQLPDLLVLDINMPKMDGFQVLELLPKEKRTFPVILLSNLADERTLARGKELGADGFLIKKDMTIKGLIELVEKLLTLRKAS